MFAVFLPLSTHAGDPPDAVLATALKRSQGNIRDVEAKLQAQQQAHVQLSRESAAQQHKMVRWMKLQRQVSELKNKQSESRARCLRAGEQRLVIVLTTGRHPSSL
jgi:septal ring factor EnvC (AmiA/AmiB activator)